MTRVELRQAKLHNAATWLAVAAAAAREVARGRLGPYRRRATEARVAIALHQARRLFAWCDEPDLAHRAAALWTSAINLYLWRQS